MKIFKVFFLFLILCIVSAGCAIYFHPSPESSIVGDWNEHKWEYEKAEENLIQKNKISTEVKAIAGRNLRIHAAESWEFAKDGTLKLIGPENESIANWYIKGRGHILQIRYSDRTTENYNIVEVTDDKLILNFEVAQARGVAKLTFIKNKQYAQKI